MTGAIFHWDAKAYFDYSHQRLWFQHYDYACRAFGAEKIVVVDPKDQVDLGISKARDIETALRFFTGYEPVLIHGNGKEELSGFVHPEDAVYVVGPDYGGLGLPEGAKSVRIPMGRPIELWAATALAIVLYDRFLRG
jgi:hypothetical protein